MGTGAAVARAVNTKLYLRPCTSYESLYGYEKSRSEVLQELHVHTRTHKRNHGVIGTPREGRNMQLCCGLGVPNCCCCGLCAGSWKILLCGRRERGPKKGKGQTAVIFYELVLHLGCIQFNWSCLRVPGFWEDLRRLEARQSSATSCGATTDNRSTDLGGERVSANTTL